MIRIREIDHLVLRVSDLPRMLEFYCRVLGCVVERRQEELGLVQIRAGRAFLAANGVVMGEVASRYGAEGEGMSVYVSDPEGNTVELKGPPS